MENKKKNRPKRKKAGNKKAIFAITGMATFTIILLFLLIITQGLDLSVAVASQELAQQEKSPEHRSTVLENEGTDAGRSRYEDELVVSDSNPEKIPEKTQPEIPPSSPPEKPEPDFAGTLVFVIDDVGNNLDQLDKFLRIPGPITFAVMPQREYSVEAVRRIKAAGKTAIIHQPMEPVGDSNPGAGAIYVTMTKEEIWDTLDKNIANTGVTLGLNNHMGSLATSDPETMDAVLTYMKDRNMVFLDSFTTGKSVGAIMANEMGVRYTKRNSMFLDNESDRESIYNAIKAGEETARKKGHAVMIGHVMTDELAELLFELYPTFIDDGFTIKDLSDLLHGEFNADSWD